MKGDRKGQHSIRINDQFRLCFNWTAAGPAGVEIVARITTHPGEILREEYLVPYQMSGNAPALELHVPANRITEIVKCKRSVTADTALRLARYFDTTPGFWLNLQVNHDLSKAQAEKGQKVEREVRVREMA